MSPARFEEIRPEPARFWVRWAPRGWRGPDVPFLDLARGTLAPAALRRGRPPARTPSGPPDLLYLPPVAADSGSHIEGWIERGREAGHSLLVQVVAGESVPAGASTVVLDVTAAVLAGDLDRVNAAPPGAVAAWPLIGGLSDDPGLLRDGCERLRGAGVTTVQGVVPTLTPRQRRRLSAQGGERVYQALFHGPPASPVPLARIAVEHGLWPWFDRPEAPGGGRRGRNRALAAHLAVLAEWRLLLGHPEGTAQALFRAARWVDDEERDVVAIAAEGNLGIVDWLEPSARYEIERYAAAGAGAAFTELTEELLARGSR